jgi:glycosyltransferase involved in cell wall biosynthesis
MKILNISLDNSVLDKNSPAGERVSWYEKLFDKYTIIAPDRNTNKIFALYKIYSQANKILTNEKYNVITVQDQYYLALLGWLLARKFKVCLHLQIHGFEKFFGLRKLIAKFVIPKADAIRCVSERLKRQLISNFNAQDSKISVVPIYVDIKKIKGAPIKTDLRKKYPQFDFIILMANRFSKVKNIPLAIEAMTKIVGKYPKTGLIIAGEGSERKILELKVKSEKLKENVVFESWQDKETIYSYYKTADLFLVTSDYEGYGMTIIEAFTSGLQVLSTDVGIAREAGAIITERDNIAENIVKYIEIEDKTISRPPLDMGYPYKNKEDYLDKFKQSFICVS